MGNLSYLGYWQKREMSRYPSDETRYSMPSYFIFIQQITFESSSLRYMWIISLKGNHGFFSQKQWFYLISYFLPLKKKTPNLLSSFAGPPAFKIFLQIFYTENWVMSVGFFPTIYYSFFSPLKKGMAYVSCIITCVISHLVHIPLKLLVEVSTQSLKSRQFS